MDYSKFKRLNKEGRKIKKDKISKREKMYNYLANFQQKLINTAINMITDANLSDDDKDIMINNAVDIINFNVNTDNKKNTGENID